MEIAERTHHNALVNQLRPYILEAKRQLGIVKCERCNADGPFELNHKRYSADVTIYDLELLCLPCHRQQTGWAHEMAQIGDYCSHCQRPY